MADLIEHVSRSANFHFDYYWHNLFCSLFLPRECQDYSCWTITV